MIKVEHSVVVNRPVSEVFDFAGTHYVQNHPRWSARIKEYSQTSPGPLGVGSTVRVVRLVRGKEEETTSTITQFEPNRRLSFQDDGQMQARGGYVYESVDGGTKVTFTMEAQPGGFGRLAAPIISRELNKSIEEDLATLKGLIEGA